MNIVNQNLVVVLQGYLRRYVSLEELKAWLAESVWAISASDSPLDRMLLGELELALAEYDRGDRDEAYLADHIRFLLRLPNPKFVPRFAKSRLPHVSA